MRKGWFPAPLATDRPGLTTDLTAGLTLGVLLVPQAMAYGMLAGVPPVYGLYAALVPLVLYALLASTPHVSVGPTALASLLCLNGLSGLAEPGTDEYLELAITLAALTGLLQLLFGLLRMGGIVSLLSRPVLSGFVSAAAALIIVSQVDTLLGIDVPSSTYLHETLYALAARLGSVHWPSVLMGGGTLAGLFAARRWLPDRFPTMLALVVVTTLLQWGVGHRWGVDTVGDIPAGLPSLSLPVMEVTTWGELLPVAAVLALISFIETLSIGKTLNEGHDYYRIRPNRELVALGISKVAGSFFQAIPTSASFSRSAVVENAGATRPLANVVAAGFLLAVLLFLTPLFYFLPLPVLAAIIVFSVRKLFDLAEMRRLRHLAPKEFATLLITFFFTLFAGLQYGIAGGVLLSLYFVFARAARPHLAELGRIPGTNAFRNQTRFSNVEIDPKILIVRFDAELYFGNADYFVDQLQRLVDQRGPELSTVILDGHTIHDIDTSGLYALGSFLDTLERRSVALYLTGIIGPVRDRLFQSGLMERMGAERHFLSIQQALLYIQGDTPRRGWDLPALQHE